MQHCNALSLWTYPRQWLRRRDEKSNLNSTDTVGPSKICINFASLYNQSSSWFIWKKHSCLNTLLIDFAEKDICVREGSHRMIGWVIPGLLALLPKFWPTIMFWDSLKEYWGGRIDQISCNLFQGIHFRCGNIFCFWVCCIKHESVWCHQIESPTFGRNIFVRKVLGEEFVQVGGWLSIIRGSFCAEVILCSFWAEWPQFNGGAVQYKASIWTAIWEPERRTKRKKPKRTRKQKNKGTIPETRKKTNFVPIERKKIDLILKFSFQLIFLNY